jgi:hypothetical protein
MDCASLIIGWDDDGENQIVKKSWVKVPILTELLKEDLYKTSFDRICKKR